MIEAFVGQRASHGRSLWFRVTLKSCSEPLRMFVAVMRDSSILEAICDTVNEPSARTPGPFGSPVDRVAIRLKFSRTLEDLRTCNRSWTAVEGRASIEPAKVYGLDIN